MDASPPRSDSVLLQRSPVVTSAVSFSFTQGGGRGGGGGGGGGGWLNWLYRKGKNEAHLPDDKNKSVSCYTCYFRILLCSLQYFCISFAHVSSNVGPVLRALWS